MAITFNFEAGISTVRTPSQAKRAREYREGKRGRFVIVAVKKDGTLPKVWTVTTSNSSDDVDRAKENCRAVHDLNPGKGFAVVDRASPNQVDVYWVAANGRVFERV